MSAARFFTRAVRQLRPLQPTLAASRPKTVMRPSLVIRSMSSDGQITSELVQRMQTKIQEALQAQRVEVADMAGDGRHVEIVVVAKEFEGKSAVNRQRMVYKVGKAKLH
jgi:stress-induced morphogen